MVLSCTCLSYQIQGNDICLKSFEVFRMANYKRFLATVAAEASYRRFYIIEPYINEVQAHAVSFINGGCYKLHPYLVADLSNNVMMMKASEVESLCSACGLNISVDDCGNKILPTKISLRHEYSHQHLRTCLSVPMPWAMWKRPCVAPKKFKPSET